MLGESPPKIVCNIGSEGNLQIELKYQLDKFLL